MTTRPLSCRDAARQLWALLDDDLAEPDRHAVLDHLRTCVACESHRRYAQAFRRAVRVVGQRIDPPATLGPTVRAALQRASGGT
jgi:anti-sigma factor RsiW